MHEGHNPDTAWKHHAGTTGVQKNVVSPQTQILLPNSSCQHTSNHQQLPDRFRSKPITKQRLQPPNKKIYDLINGPDNLLQINLVGPHPPSSGFTHILTTFNVSSGNMFKSPQRALGREKSDIDFHQTRVRPDNHTDGQRHRVHCRSCETKDGTSRH